MKSETPLSDTNISYKMIRKKRVHNLVHGNYEYKLKWDKSPFIVLLNLTNLSEHAYPNIYV